MSINETNPTVSERAIPAPKDLDLTLTPTAKQLRVWYDRLVTYLRTMEDLDRAVLLRITADGEGAPYVYAMSLPEEVHEEDA